MRRALAPLALAVLATTSACSSGTHVTTTPATTAAASAPESASSAASGPTPSTPSTPAAPSTASVGQAINLTGTKPGESVDVTVVQIVDPAPPKDASAGPTPSPSPTPGMRDVAVQFQLKNTGTATYSDSPGNGAKVIDTQGQEFSQSFGETGAGPGFTGTTTITPGDVALGFVTFQLPSSSKVAKVQFALDSGFATDVGQWNAS
ncbi:DUF4352 domain-containing protein [Kitasatospora sp. NPDC058965]|uniref:DUF4352 domain-containing protein n=1 Tax=Kitasatospora sp. NPDC058965 TaxID=3346682 RepID=UPI0036B74450